MTDQTLRVRKAKKEFEEHIANNAWADSKRSLHISQQEARNVISGT